MTLFETIATMTGTFVGLKALFWFIDPPSSNTLAIEELEKAADNMRARHAELDRARQAQRVVQTDDNGNPIMDYAFSSTTGIPLPSVAGVAGAMSHHSRHTDSASYSDSSCDSGGDDSGGDGGCD